MKSISALLLGLLLFVSVSAIPNACAQTAAHTDVYYVHFAKAALGKGAEEGNYLKQPTGSNPDAPMANHLIVLRHQSGEDWDYAAITHIGAKATVDAARIPQPAGARDLNAWHTDTFASGPSWQEFSRAMGLDDPTKSAGSVYIVSAFRAAPGHRDELEKAISEPTQGVAGLVVLQHLDGAAWHFVTITRYSSWEDFAGPVHALFLPFYSPHTSSRRVRRTILCFAVSRIPPTPPSRALGGTG